MSSISTTQVMRARSMPDLRYGSDVASTALLPAASPSEQSTSRAARFFMTFFPAPRSFQPRPQLCRTPDASDIEVLLRGAIVDARYGQRRTTQEASFMSRIAFQWSACALIVAGALAWGGRTAHADRANQQQDQNQDQDGRRTVFVIAMENHNWTQPASTTSPQPDRKSVV